MATANLGRVGFVNKGTYSGSTEYKVNDVVVYNSGTYACIQAHTGQVPTNTSYWQNWVANDKALDSAVVHKTGDETIAGVKTFSSSPISSAAQSTAENALTRKDYVDGLDSANVKLTGDETIAGIKSFSDGVRVQNQNVSPFSGFKNYIINGNFDVWQRGASQTSSGYGSDDRWVNVNTGSTKNHSQVACTDTEVALFNASYFSRTVVTSVAGAGNECDKWQNIEDVSRLAGKTVTLSFWAKADSAKNIGIWFDQVFGSGGSAAVTLISNQLVALTTTWQKKTITVTLPSIVGKTVGLSSFTRVVFGFDNAAALVGRQSGTFDIAQVQLEEGSVATPFEQRPYGLELSLCQRYYWKPELFLTSVSISNGRTHNSFVLPNKMRVQSTIVYSDLVGTVGKVTTTAGNGVSFSTGSIYGDVDAIKLDAILPTVSSNVAFYVTASAEL